MLSNTPSRKDRPFFRRSQSISWFLRWYGPYLDTGICRRKISKILSGTTTIGASDMSLVAHIPHSRTSNVWKWSCMAMGYLSQRMEPLTWSLDVPSFEKPLFATSVCCSESFSTSCKGSGRSASSSLCRLTLSHNLEPYDPWGWHLVIERILLL